MRRITLYAASHPTDPTVAKASAQQAAVGRRDPALSVGVGWPPLSFPLLYHECSSQYRGPLIFWVKGKEVR